MNVRLRLWKTLDTIAHFIGFGHAPNWLCDRYDAALWASVGDTVEDKPA